MLTSRARGRDAALRFASQTALFVSQRGLGMSGEREFTYSFSILPYREQSFSLVNIAIQNAAELK